MARCEAQTGVRKVLWFNAVSLPRAVFCSSPAEPGSRFCADHQHQNTHPHQFV
jgi:hypothetical protein